MTASQWLALAVCLVGSVSSKSRSSGYSEVVGRNTKSGKVNMSTILARSRIRCAAGCLDLPGCGGVNIWKLENGSSLCEFKQGVTKTSDIDTVTEVGYYEMTVQNPHILSRDCADLRSLGITVSGVHKINVDPDGSAPELIDVYCDMDTDGGGWTTLLRRVDGLENFNRDWAQYKAGFGKASGDHWLGLDAMRRLLDNGRPYAVRVDLTSYSDARAYAVYTEFNISSEDDFYRIRVSGYSGTAGDALAYHNDMLFSTLDVDNDNTYFSCAEASQGGFWYNRCSHARLTGLYGESLPALTLEYGAFSQGIIWYEWLGLDHPKYADMKIRALY